MPPDTARVSGLVAAGRRALDRGDLAQARTLFAGAGKVPEALEGFAAVEWREGDAAAAIRVLERAYQGYSRRGDRLSAGRLATELAYDGYVVRGDPTVVRGWLGRARRWLEDHQDTPEFAWVRFWEGDFAMLVERNPGIARQAAVEAAALARHCGDGDLEMLAVALEGLTLVSLGEVTAGMRLLDESGAAAAGGEFGGADAHLIACCYLIFACDRARDFSRAARWCEYVRRTAAELDHQFSLSVCRSHYAGLLMAGGEWAEAERELATAIAALELATPPWAAEGVCRLAELRRRQGSAEEAADLLDQAERPPLRMLAEPEALLVRAELALDAGDPVQAVGLAERYLRRVPPGDRPERVAGLELLVRARVATGRGDDARPALDELADTAALLDSAAVHGLSCLARGSVAVASARLEAGQREFEDAVDHFTAAGLPFEEARARLELGRVLHGLGRGPEGEKEIETAAETFSSLGAAAGLAEARRVRQLSPPAPDQGAATGDCGLTPRELDVLRLLASGRDNDHIARQLVLSLRTVERHVSNLYVKIGVSGRVARAGAAAYAYRHGLMSAEPPAQMS